MNNETKKKLSKIVFIGDSSLHLFTIILDFFAFLSEKKIMMFQERVSRSGRYNKKYFKDFLLLNRHMLKQVCV